MCDNEEELMEGFEGQAEEYKFGPVGDGTSVESHMMKTVRKVVLAALWDNLQLRVAVEYCNRTLVG